MDTPTFASFLTPQGIIVAGGLITAFVQLVKTVLPAIDARVSGALLSFVVSGVIYAIAAFATGASTPDALLLVFASWLACATSAVGVYSATTHASGRGG